tara:strand:+ start:167027 stop:167443 length:417 start_codon:yes stop_codon:yes gene_type:complete
MYKAIITDKVCEISKDILGVELRAAQARDLDDDCLIVHAHFNVPSKPIDLNLVYSRESTKALLSAAYEGNSSMFSHESNIEDITSEVSSLLFHRLKYFLKQADVNCDAPNAKVISKTCLLEQGEPMVFLIEDSVVLKA